VCLFSNESDVQFLRDNSANERAAPKTHHAQKSIISTEKSSQQRFRKFVPKTAKLQRSDFFAPTTLISILTAVVTTGLAIDQALDNRKKTAELVVTKQARDDNATAALSLANEHLSATPETTPTLSPGNTATPSPTITPVGSPSATPIRTPTPSTETTPTPLPTMTPFGTPSATAIRTPTPLPGTTPTPSPTMTPVGTPSATPFRTPTVNPSPSPIAKKPRIFVYFANANQVGRMLTDVIRVLPREGFDLVEAKQMAEQRRPKKTTILYFDRKDKPTAERIKEVLGQRLQVATADVQLYDPNNKSSPPTSGRDPNEFEIWFDWSVRSPMGMFGR
jgi:hypothetical protein